MLAILPVFLSIRPAFLRDAEERPRISGPTLYIERGRFRIHFATEGSDAPEKIDQDGNGLPDLIDEIAAGFVEGEREFLYEGWRPLVNDDGTGGSTTIDVYVHKIDAYGYATPIPAPSGGSSCFLEIDENIQLTGKVARSVAKHELHHCVEFRYAPQTVAWLFEAAATYEQYSHEEDPVLDYALGFLWSERLAEPERRLGDTSGRNEYAAFLWMKYWSEAGGFDPGRLPRMWEALETGETWQEALDDEASRVFGEDLSSLYLDHAVWNTFACANDDSQHYLSDPLACIVESAVPIAEWDGKPIDIVHEDAPFTVTYLSLPSKGKDVAVSCEGSEGLRLALVSVDEAGREVDLAVDASGQPVQVSTIKDGTVRVVIAGTGTEPLAATCEEVPPRKVAKRLAAGCSVLGSGSAGGLWAAGLALLALSRRRA